MHPDIELNPEDNIRIRLSIIDATYSTQMGRRLYGIQELAEKIYNVCAEETIKKHDDAFIRKLTDYMNKIKNGQNINGIENLDDPIEKLLNNEQYGIRKNGYDSAGEARSLISKYCYYLSNYKFPIEDSLLRDNTNDILKYFNISKNENNKTNEKIIKKNDLIKQLIILCNKHNFEFDKFDHLVWAYGRIKRGSLSIFISKENYKEITSQLQIKDLLTKRKKYIKTNKPKASIRFDLADSIIKEQLMKQNLLKKTWENKWISDDLYTFINLCFECEKVCSKSDKKK